MSAEWFSFSGLALMFVLGLRHGLDPDHIACIDGLTWRTLGRQGHRRYAPWIGSLFALGHGLLVTSIAVGVSLVAHEITFPDTLVEVLEWVPTALLLLVGTMNLRLLLRGNAAFQPTGWKLLLIPRRLRDHGSPWTIVLIGVLFVTVFDTATQAAAWGYVASHRGGVPAALAAGLVFTLGMIITDTLDSRLICAIERSSNGQEFGRYSRVLGWLIVGVSYAVATYNIGKSLLPSMEMNEDVFSVTGLALVLMMAAVWGWLGVRR